MEKQLAFLKQKYNYNLNRNRNAEEYFKTHTVEECLKYINLFNEVTKELSNLKIKIENLIYRDMTKEEILNGFK